MCQVPRCIWLAHPRGGNELEFRLEAHYRRWQGPWSPTQGDLVNLQIGYEAEMFLPCGDFQVDEMELVGPPDVFSLRCLSAYITPAMRTPNSAGYENQTLLQIASTIASKCGKTVLGAPNDINVTFQRKTQKLETDVAFLRRIAGEHDYDFTVTGNQFVFYARPALEALPPIQPCRAAIPSTSRLDARTRRMRCHAPSRSCIAITCFRLPGR
jgi:uncharacterized protein